MVAQTQTIRYWYRPYTHVKALWNMSIAVKYFNSLLMWDGSEIANTTFRLSSLRLDWLLTNVDDKIAVWISVADMVIRFGRYGLFVWPMWLWPIWSVADMVQTRYTQLRIVASSTISGHWPLYMLLKPRQRSLEWHHVIRGCPSFLLVFLESCIPFRAWNSNGKHVH